jgi:mycothiol synthase
MLSIRTVDPPDEQALQAAYSVFRDGVSAGRTAALVTPYETFRDSLRDPSPWKDTVLLAAYESEDHERPLGVAMLELPKRDNRHLAELEIAVLPRQRGRGVGEALYAEGHARARAAQRSTMIGELFVEAGLEIDDAPGGRFALRHGYASVHCEDHLVLDLPASLPEAVRPSGYHVRSWEGPCPDDLVTSYAEMRHAMERDVPTGDLDVEPRSWDVARVREHEQRMTKLDYTMLVSVAAADGQSTAGRLVGYTMMLLPGHGSTDVYQEDTLVVPSHRGHGLGTVLKAANMNVLAAGFPQRRRIHTWTAAANAPMQLINRAFGFRVAEKMHEIQRVEDTDG